VSALTDRPRLVCAEKDCGDLPTLQLVLADGIGEFELGFGCSPPHLSTLMRATAHLTEGWYPVAFERRTEPIPMPTAAELANVAGTGDLSCR
jgi:hypothetical protein